MDRRSTVLVFHGIGEPHRNLEDGEAPLWIEPERFEAILDVVAERSGLVELTFDDGNSSDLEFALLGLMRRKLTATFFVLAGRLGQAGSLDAADVRSLSSAGMRIGNHGMLHEPWREMAAEKLQVELVEARRVLASVVNRSVEEAACPRGSYNRRVLQALRRERYQRVHTSDGGRTKSSGWLVARHSVSVRDEPAGIARLIDAGEPLAQAATRAAKKLVKRCR